MVITTRKYCITDKKKIIKKIVGKITFNDG